MTTQQTVKKFNWFVARLGAKQSHRDTVRGLGLRKLNSVSELVDTPCCARHD